MKNRKPESIVTTYPKKDLKRVIKMLETANMGKALTTQDVEKIISVVYGLTPMSLDEQTFLTLIRKVVKNFWNV